MCVPVCGVCRFFRQCEHHAAGAGGSWATAKAPLESNTAHRRPHTHTAGNTHISPKNTHTPFRVDITLIQHLSLRIKEFLLVKIKVHQKAVRSLVFPA